MIYALILGIHLLICIFLVVVVLLQAGKGGGLAGAFGVAGGAAQNLFGGRGAATFLSKATTALGISFMTTSLILALLGGQGGEARSVLRDLQAEPGTAAPPPSMVPLEIPSGSDAGAPSGSEGLPGLLETAPAGTPTEAQPSPEGGTPVPATEGSGTPPASEPSSGGGN